MKDLPKLLISLLAGFVLGFGGFSVVQVGQRKLRTAVFLAEAEGQVRGLRAKLATYYADQGHYPRHAADMVAAGFWTVEEPPYERLRGSADWVSEFDGAGGFVYLSATGQVYLNADLKREKLRKADELKLQTGDLLPPGAFF